MTGFTSLGTVIVLRTAAMTFGTGHIFLNLDLLFDSGSDLFQVQLYFHTQIRTTIYPATAT